MILLLKDGAIELHQGAEVFYPASDKHSRNIVSRSLKRFGRLSPETAIELLQEGIKCDCAFLFNGQAHFME